MTKIRYKDKYFEDAKGYFKFMIDELGFPDIIDFFDEEYLENDGIKIHLDIHSYHKDAPTVVFVPGTSVYSLCYAELLSEIGKSGYNIVAMDPRGHGRSSGSRGDYTIRELMDDVKAVVKFAKKRFNQNIALMGSSQGGIVSFYLAAEKIKVDTIICQNFADLTWSETAQIARYPKLAKAGKPFINILGSVLPSVKVSTLTYLNLKKIKLKYFDNLHNFIVHDPFTISKISLRAAKSLVNAEMKMPPEKITIPTFVFQGASDIVFPLSYTEKLYDRLTCPKQMTVYKDCDHAIMVENVDLIKKDIIVWLDNIYTNKVQ